MRISKQSSICSRDPRHNYPMKSVLSEQKKNFSQESQRSLQKFLEQNRRSQVIYTDNSLDHDEVFEDLYCNHCTSQHHTDRNQMGLLKEQYAEWKKEPLQYCCNQFWMKIGGQNHWNTIPICGTFWQRSTWLEYAVCLNCRRSYTRTASDERTCCIRESVGE